VAIIVLAAAKISAINKYVYDGFFSFNDMLLLLGLLVAGLLFNGDGVGESGTDVGDGFMVGGRVLWVICATTTVPFVHVQLISLFSSF